MDRKNVCSREWREEINLSRVEMIKERINPRNY